MKWSAQTHEYPGERQRDPVEAAEYYYLGRHLITQKTNGVTTYIHTDACGSVTRKTNSTGGIVEDRIYEPYGESLEVTTRAPQWPQGMTYTGHVLDNLTRIAYAQARYYDQLMGRFMSPDPVAPDAGNFNRYWYANNNPFSLVDPDGRKACGKDTTCSLERGDWGGSTAGFYGVGRQSVGSTTRGPSGEASVPNLLGVEESGFKTRGAAAKAFGGKYYKKSVSERSEYQTGIVKVGDGYGYITPGAGPPGVGIVDPRKLFNAIKEAGYEIYAWAHTHWDENLKFSGTDMQFAQTATLFMTNSAGRTYMLNADIVKRAAHGYSGVNKIREFINSSSRIQGELVE